MKRPVHGHSECLRIASVLCPMSGRRNTISKQFLSFRTTPDTLDPRSASARESWLSRHTAPLSSNHARPASRPPTGIPSSCTKATRWRSSRRACARTPSIEPWKTCAGGALPCSATGLAGMDTPRTAAKAKHASVAATNARLVIMNVSTEDTSDVVRQCLAHVMKKLGSHADTAFAVKVALVSSCRDREDLTSTLFSARDAKMLSSAILDECKVNPSQFGAIVRFCVVNQRSSVSELSNADHAQAAVKCVERALVCTLDEQRQKVHWQNPAVQVASALALNFDDPQPYVDACVWTVVRADLRRLEELRRDVESKATPLFFVGQSIESLSHSFL